MASPPRRYSATSPPYQAPSSIAGRKRPLPNLSTNAPFPAKRTNTSFSTTSSSHPLRQTSFPPEEGQQGARSPSVDSAITTGTAVQSTNASASKPKKRGRKRKEDTQSVRSGTARRTPQDAGSRTSRGGAGDDEQDAEDDDEDADRAADDLIQTGAKVNDEHEQQRIAVLLAAFDLDQSERYDLHRRVKLRKETVRKIVNQTLSQSVPPSVITTINGYTKVFLASLIERARDVQEQSILAAEKYPTPARSPPNTAASGPTPASQQDQRLSVDNLPIKTDSGYMGPLTPDHFREAYRRYRRDGEGGGAGVDGRSVGLGVTGATSVRLGGRRLFK